MQMWNSLAGVRPIIEDEAKTSLSQTELLSHFRSLQDEMTQHLVILGFRVRNPWNWSFRNYENMRGCLRFYISKGDD